MDCEEQKRVLRERKSGYAVLRRFDIEEMRSATFPDRLEAFCRVLSLSECLPKEESREDDDEVTRKWTRIRAANDAGRR